MLLYPIFSSLLAMSEVAKCTACGWRRADLPPMTGGWLRRLHASVESYSWI